MANYRPCIFCHLTLTQYAACDVCAIDHAQDPKEAEKHHMDCQAHWFKDVPCQCSAIVGMHYA